jgi:hypothetical protein
MNSDGAPISRSGPHPGILALLYTAFFCQDRLNRLMNDRIEIEAEMPSGCFEETRFPVHSV